MIQYCTNTALYFPLAVQYQSFLPRKERQEARGESKWVATDGGDGLRFGIPYSQWRRGTEGEERERESRVPLNILLWTRAGKKGRKRVQKSILLL